MSFVIAAPEALVAVASDLAGIGSALALSQVNRVIAAVRGQEATPEPPSALNTTLEFDLNAGSIVARQWTRHPRCFC